jgi:hypothetical protein
MVALFNDPLRIEGVAANSCSTITIRFFSISAASSPTRTTDTASFGEAATERTGKPWSNFSPGTRLSRRSDSVAPEQTRRIAEALQQRVVLGQATSTIDIRRIIDNGAILICDLSGLGGEPARP